MSTKIIKYISVCLLVLAFAALGTGVAKATVTINASAVTGDGALTVTSGATTALTLDSGTTGAVDIATGTAAKTITIGNATTSTGLVLTTGTGGLDFSSTIATADAIDVTANSLTLGDVFDIDATAITQGDLLDLTVAATRTSGSAIRITDASAVSVATNPLIDINVNSTATTNILDITYATGVGPTGNAVALNMGTNVAGDALNIASAATTGNGVVITNTSARAGGSALAITDSATVTASAATAFITASTIVDVDALTITTAAQTTGNAMTINAGASAYTTGTALEVTGSGIYATDADAGLLAVNATGIATDGYIASILANVATTVDAVVQISGNALTSGNGLVVAGTGTGLTGNLFSVTSASTGAATNGLARFNFSGAHTNNGLQIDDATATGAGVVLTANALTTGTGLRVISSGIIATTGELVELTASGATDSTGVVRLTTAGLTTGTALLVQTSTSPFTTGGKAIEVDLVAATAGNGITVTTTGAYTGTGLLRLVAASATTGQSLATSGGQVSLTPTQAIASAAGATWNGVTIPATTATLSGTTAITTATGFNLVNISQPTLSAAGAVAVTNSATLYIANSPTVASLATIANPYALWVDAGVTRLDGAVTIGDDITFSAATPTIIITNTETFSLTDGTNNLFQIIDGGAITLGTAASVATTSITLAAPATDAGLVLPLTSVSAGEIVTDTLTATQLAATLTLADGDFLNLSALNASAVTEGMRLPQAVDCNVASAGITEGAICWDTDGDTLIIGTGAGVSTINPGTGQANTWTNVNTFQDNEIFTFVADEDIAIAHDAGALTGSGGVLKINVTPNAVDTANVSGIYIDNLDSAAASGLDSGLTIDNSDITGADMADGILFSSAGAVITDAIDATATQIVNAINIGTNVILGTTGTIALTDFTVGADGNVSILPDDTGDALTITLAAGDLQAIVIDAATADSTNALGLIQLTMDTVTASANAVSIDFQVNDAAGANTYIASETLVTVDIDAGQIATVYGNYVGLTINHATGVTYGMAVEQAAAAEVVTAGILVDNLDLDDAMTNGILLRAAAGAMTTALNASDAEITTALSVGANAIEATELDFNIAPTASTSSIAITADVDAEDFLIDLIGAVNTTLALRSAGNSVDALTLTTTAGGMDISVTGNLAGEDLDITTVGATTEMRFSSASTEVDAIDILTTGTLGGIDIDTTDGVINISAVGATNGDLIITVGDDFTLTGVATSVIRIGNASAGLRYFEETETVTTSHTLAIEESGKTFYWLTTGYNLTLPAVSTANGVVYRFVVANDFATSATVITGNTSENKIEGSLIVAGALVTCTTASDTITIVATADSIGDFVEIRSNGATWFINSNIGELAGAMTCTQLSV